MNIKRVSLKILVLLFVSFNACSQNAEKRIENVFKEYEKLNRAFLEEKKDSERKMLEEYAEGVLHPTLSTFYEMTCENFNGNLFAKFIDMLFYTKNSSDEIPVNLLGRIFVCQPHCTFNFINSIEEENKKKTVVGLLELGFLNESHLNKLDDSLKLKEYIDTLKKNIQ